jgi:hypothetical protein
MVAGGLPNNFIFLCCFSSTFIYVNVCVIFQKLDEKIPYTRHHVSMKELAKVCGTISSLIIPIHIQRTPKMLSSDITNADLGCYTTWLTY